LKFLASDDLDKTKNTTEALSSQFDEPFVLVAQDPDDDKVIHLRFSDKKDQKLLTYDPLEPLV